MFRPCVLILALAVAFALPACEKETLPPVSSAPASHPAPLVFTPHTIQVHGKPRTYLLHSPTLPGSPDPVIGKRPLVVLLHGATDSAEFALRAYNFVEKSDKEGFVLVAPDAVGDRRAWQALDATPNADLDFLSALLDEVIKAENIDPTKVYLAGHSAGAGMAYRYAAEHAQRIAAVGVVAGFIERRIGNELTPAFPKPVRPMPVIAFHGEKDTNLPIEESGSPAAKWWAKQADCFPTPRGDTYGQDVVRWSYHHGKASVILYTLREGNHMWPGGKAMPEKPTPPGFPDATELMWEFFKSYQLPAAPAPASASKPAA